MALERTLSIVKPDGVAANQIGEVYRRFEAGGLRIIAARMMHFSVASGRRPFTRFTASARSTRTW
jgi:nucleoside-diphosphate kinase